MLVFFGGDHGSTGWYDNPQLTLTPVFIWRPNAQRRCMRSFCLCKCCAVALVVTARVYVSMRALCCTNVFMMSTPAQLLVSLGVNLSSHYALRPRDVHNTSSHKTETRRDVPKNVSRPPRDRDVQDRDYIHANETVECGR